MLCLKCKKEIADDLLRCSYCNTKIQTVCPVCGSKNVITSEFCAGCGLQLLKYCDECKAVNLPTAEKCRKCGVEFEIDEAAIKISDIDKDGVEITKVESAKITVKNDELVKDSTGVLPVLSNSPLELVNVQSADSEDRKSISTFTDLLSLAEETTSIEEKLKEENLSEAPVINSDTLKVNLENNEDNSVLSDDIDVVQEISNEVDTIEPVLEKNEKQEEPEELEILPEIVEYDQSKCKNLIVKAILDSNKKIIGFSAPEGSGKSTVLKYLFEDLKNQPRAWFWGECSANSQISPYGVFQEMILTFFNMPNFSNMSEEFLAQARQMLSATLPFFTYDEITNLINFLYPHLTAKFEDILLNKDITFALLEKLLLELSKKVKMILVIDDFDMIDGASFEFLSNFVDKGNLGENIKLLITYKDKRITQGYFYSEQLKQNEYTDVRLAELSKADCDNLIKMYLGCSSNPIPEDIFDRIYEFSKGNCAYIEQILTLFNEKKVFLKENNSIKYQQDKFVDDLPQSLHDILSMRLEHLKNTDSLSYRLLCTASIMGNKFNIRLLEIIMKLKPEEFEKVINLLSGYAYITPFNNNIYEFKNTLLWQFIYEQAKDNKDFCMLNEKIFDIINSFVLSSNALKALIAQNLNQKLLALNIWTDNIKLCAYLGDEHLWTLSQKQCLKITGEITPDNNDVIANNIQERLGKLSYKTRPSEAIPYLSNAITNAMKIANKPKIIELSGYLSKSCALTGNYNGVIEAVDTVINIIDSPDTKLECALIKFKKLRAMLNIGNAEEIYNLASNEIIPVIEQALSELIPLNDIPMQIVYETWLECNLTVAMALVIQGNKKCFEILKLIDEIVIKNNVDNKNYLQRVELAKALAHSILGNIKESENVLINLTQQTAKEVVEPEVISLWNFINILNKLYKQEWTNIKEDMYSVVTFANNYNDVLVKNLLKVFLGRVLQEEGNFSKAMDIFNEQVTIFAREKIAVGALFCWYNIAKLSLVTESSDKALDIAEKALDVAKNPKISNYYFMVLFKKLIAEIYLIKGDMDASKMYIEKALLIVKQYDLKLLKVSLYQLYAKYLEEMVSKKPQNRGNYAQNAIATYTKVLAMVEKMELPNIQAIINKDFASFKAFCQLNDLKI